MGTISQVLEDPDEDAPRAAPARLEEQERQAKFEEALKAMGTPGFTEGDRVKFEQLARSYGDVLKIKDIDESLKEQARDAIQNVEQDGGGQPATLPESK